MAKPKLYESLAWMTRKYAVQRMSEAEIAKEAGTTQATVNRWLVKHDLKRKRR